MRYIVVPIHALVSQGAEPASAGADARPDEGDGASDDALACWVEAARSSLDACLVVDACGSVAGLSPTAADLLGAEAGALVGRQLDDVLNLVDFTDVALEARGVDRRIPPLIAVRENSLSRGMMRLRRPDGHRLMLDAVAAPIHDGERNPIGAVSFLASI